MEKQGKKSNEITEINSIGHFESSEPVENQSLENRKIELMNSPTLFFKRNKMRLNAKIKAALVKLNYQKSQFKREQILKTRQEKLQKFRINYIPLCSDEDWEAMSTFYTKNSKK